jgi:hypothetical protein
MGTIAGMNTDGMAHKESARSPADPGSGQQTGALPDFIIIGAQKGGTTTLYRLLSQHPSVLPAAKKELHYFSLFFDRGTEWYRSCFPAPKHKNGQSTITGEASPYYLFHPHAPRRVAEAVPRARLIALLRDPVARAYSHYNHEVTTVSRLFGTGIEPSTFEEALDLEELRLRGEGDKMLEDERYVSFNHQHFSYMSRGIYVDQLIQFSKFFSNEQVLVLRSEDFFGRTPEKLKLVLDFLGLPEWEPEAWKIVLKGEYDQEMDPSTRRRLEEYFEPHNRRLYEYLGVDFGW